MFAKGVQSHPDVICDLFLVRKIHKFHLFAFTVGVKIEMQTSFNHNKIVLFLMLPENANANVFSNAENANATNQPGGIFSSEFHTNFWIPLFSMYRFLANSTRTLLQHFILFHAHYYKRGKKRSSLKCVHLLPFINIIYIRLCLFCRLKMIMARTKDQNIMNFS